MKTVTAQQWRELQTALPSRDVLTDPVALVTYEVDGGLARGHPDGVIFVEKADDVVRIVTWASQHSLPLIGRGAGTGLSGGAVPHRGGLIVEFSRMNRVLELDEVGRSAIVEPGMVNQNFDEFVKTKGLYYPADPASGRSCTLGGNIAENAGGPHCFKYGVTTNYVTGLDVVLANGRQVRLGGRALDYPEYDLVGLLTGSEGTLALTVRAYVRLLRNPPAVQTLMAVFDSVEDAGEAVSALIAGGLVPATLEMMDQKIIRIVEDYTHAGLPTQAGALLIIEADGYAEGLPPQAEEISAILREHKARELRSARTAAERDKIWFARKSAIGAVARLASGYLLVDGTVPRSALARTLAAVNQICDSHELRVGYVFHAGDGNLHPLILIENPDDPAHLEQVHGAAREILAYCVKEGGTITGEHGVGIEKRKYMPFMYSEDELQAMRDIKQVFDPRALLNPDKIFPDQVKSEEAKAKSKVTLGSQPAHIPSTEPETDSVEPKPCAPSEAEPKSLEQSPSTALGVNSAESHPERSGAESKDRNSEFAPRSAAEAAEVLRTCSSAGRSVRLRGSGTKSGALPTADLLLSTRALTGIQSYSLDDLYVRVGAGTSLTDLQQELGRDRMWVPLVSPWPTSTIGGIVSTNWNAPLRLRYGGIRDLVLAMTVVLADGRTLRIGRPVVKNVAGYDLAKLFIGSYGTLGLIADVTFRITPLPRRRASLIAPVPNLGRGLELGTRLVRVCLNSSALLLCRGWSAEAGWQDAEAQLSCLVYTAEGPAEDVAAELAEVRAVLQAGGLTEITESLSFSGSEIWAGFVQRTLSSNTLIRVGVPPKDLSPTTNLVIPGLGRAPFVADLASGLLFLQRSESGESLGPAVRVVGGYAVTFGAGPRSTPEAWGYVPEGLDLMRALKAKWDERGVLNPGAILLEA